MPGVRPEQPESFTGSATRGHVLSAYIGRAGTDIIDPWKRMTSPKTHGRLFQANVSHYKQQLAD